MAQHEELGYSFISILSTYHYLNLTFKACNCSIIIFYYFSFVLDLNHLLLDHSLFILISVAQHLHLLPVLCFILKLFNFALKMLKFRIFVTIKICNVLLPGSNHGKVVMLMMNCTRETALQTYHNTDHFC